MAQAVDSTVIAAPRKITRELADAVNPQIAILLTGADPPSAEFRSALASATVLEIAQRWTIEFVVDGQRLTVRTQR